ncbi:MAG: rhomboid family intramembrane serine protease [Flavobacteriales bacterium]|nr:rhomboid family intramembrane serine protease [Flavobacteriales bacterium]
MTKDILRAIRFPLLFVLIIVLVHFYSTYYEIQLSHYGVYPRRIDSLLGVITSPFIHSDWKHLCKNSIPLVILGSSLFHFYNRLALRVWGLSILYTGLLLWLGGRPSFHIGASGLVYALAFFIFFSGLIRKHKPLMAISMIVVFIYGGLVWGIFPREAHVSWEGHLSGAFNGLFWALYYKHEGPQRKKYSWEVEEEIINSLDGIEVVYQEIIPKEQTQESVSITYDYVLKK